MSDNEGSGSGSSGDEDIPIIPESRLRECFHLSAKDACSALNVSMARLKKSCRAIGVSRWPSRKIKSLEVLRTTLLEDPHLQEEDRQVLLQRLEEQVAAVLADPDRPLDKLFADMRQTSYKVKYHQRKSTRAAESGSSAPAPALPPLLPPRCRQAVAAAKAAAAAGAGAGGSTAAGAAATIAAPPGRGRHHPSSDSESVGASGLASPPPSSRSAGAGAPVPAGPSTAARQLPPAAAARNVGSSTAQGGPQGPAATGAAFQQGRAERGAGRAGGAGAARKRRRRRWGASLEGDEEGPDSDDPSVDAEELMEEESEDASSGPDSTGSGSAGKRRGRGWRGHQQRSGGGVPLGGPTRSASVGAFALRGNRLQLDLRTGSAHLTPQQHQQHLASLQHMLERSTEDTAAGTEPRLSNESGGGGRSTVPGFHPDPYHLPNRHQYHSAPLARSFASPTLQSQLLPGSTPHARSHTLLGSPHLGDSPAPGFRSGLPPPYPQHLKSPNSPDPWGGDATAAAMVAASRVVSTGAPVRPGTTAGASSPSAGQSSYPHPDGAAAHPPMQLPPHLHQGLQHQPWNPLEPPHARPVSASPGSASPMHQGHGQGNAQMQIPTVFFDDPMDLEQPRSMDQGPQHQHPQAPRVQQPPSGIPSRFGPQSWREGALGPFPQPTPRSSAGTDQKGVPYPYGARYIYGVPYPRQPWELEGKQGQGLGHAQQLGSPLGSAPPRVSSVPPAIVIPPSPYPDVQHYRHHQAALWTSRGGPGSAEVAPSPMDEQGSRAAGWPTPRRESYPTPSPASASATGSGAGHYTGTGATGLPTAETPASRAQPPSLPGPAPCDEGLPGPGDDALHPPPHQLRHPSTSSSNVLHQGLSSPAWHPPPPPHSAGRSGYPPRPSPTVPGPSGTVRNPSTGSSSSLPMAAPAGPWESPYYNDGAGPAPAHTSGAGTHPAPGGGGAGMHLPYTPVNTPSHTPVPTASMPAGARTPAPGSDQHSAPRYPGSAPAGAGYHGWGGGGLPPRAVPPFPFAPPPFPPPSQQQHPVLEQQQQQQQGWGQEHTWSWGVVGRPLAGGSHGVQPPASELAHAEQHPGSFGAPQGTSLPSPLLRSIQPSDQYPQQGRREQQGKQQQAHGGFRPGAHAANREQQQQGGRMSVQGYGAPAGPAAAEPADRHMEDAPPLVPPEQRAQQQQQPSPAVSASAATGAAAPPGPPDQAAPAAAPAPGPAAAASSAPGPSAAPAPFVKPTLTNIPTHGSALDLIALGLEPISPCYEDLFNFETPRELRGVSPGGAALGHGLPTPPGFRGSLPGFFSSAGTPGGRAGRQSPSGKAAQAAAAAAQADVMPFRALSLSGAEVDVGLAPQLGRASVPDGAAAAEAAATEAAGPQHGQQHGSAAATPLQWWPSASPPPPPPSPPPLPPPSAAATAPGAPHGAAAGSSPDASRGVTSFQTPSAAADPVPAAQGSRPGVTISSGSTQVYGAHLGGHTDFRGFPAAPVKRPPGPLPPVATARHLQHLAAPWDDDTPTRHTASAAAATSLASQEQAAPDAPGGHAHAPAMGMGVQVGSSSSYMGGPSASGGHVVEPSVASHPGGGGEPSSASRGLRGSEGFASLPLGDEGPVVPSSMQLMADRSWSAPASMAGLAALVKEEGNMQRQQQQQLGPNPAAESYGAWSVGGSSDADRQVVAAEGAAGRVKLEELAAPGGAGPNLARPSSFTITTQINLSPGLAAGPAEGRGMGPPSGLPRGQGGRRSSGSEALAAASLVPTSSASRAHSSGGSGSRSRRRSSDSAWSGDSRDAQRARGSAAGGGMGVAWAGQGGAAGATAWGDGQAAGAPAAGAGSKPLLSLTFGARGPLAGGLHLHFNSSTQQQQQQHFQQQHTAETSAAPVDPRQLVPSLLPPWERQGQ